MVGLAFAVAASTFCPLLVLGIWWRGLTDVGALAGLAVGGGLAGIAVLVTTVIATPTGWGGALLAQPAAWAVPIAFAVMMIGSLATRRRIPQDVARMMVRLHAPEVLLGGSEPREQTDRSSRRSDRSSPRIAPSSDPNTPVDAPPAR